MVEQGNKPRTATIRVLLNSCRLNAIKNNFVKKLLSKQSKKKNENTGPGFVSRTGNKTKKLNIEKRLKKKFQKLKNNSKQKATSFATGQVLSRRN